MGCGKREKDWVVGGQAMKTHGGRNEPRLRRHSTAEPYTVKIYRVEELGELQCAL